MYISPEEYYTSFKSWSKLLAMYCKRDGIELPTIISEDGSKMISKGLVWIRNKSKIVSINSLDFRINMMHWEGSRSKDTRLYSINRNNICLVLFQTEEFNGQVKLDENNFLTVTFNLKMINQEITALVLCLDYDDVMDMVDSVNTPLRTVAINLTDSMVIFVTRSLPTFVKIDPNLKVDPESENPIYKDKILDHMIFNIHVNSCGVPNYTGYDR